MHSFIMDWKTTISDSDEAKIFAALDEPDTTWRTVSAIARETGVPEARVEEILAKYDLQLTRYAEELSFLGTPLVGLIENVGV
jgi:hypothetical protein